jgi:hypothetical protein
MSEATSTIIRINAKQITRSADHRGAAIRDQCCNEEHQKRGEPLDDAHHMGSNVVSG